TPGAACQKLKRTPPQGLGKAMFADHKAFGLGPNGEPLLLFTRLAEATNRANAFDETVLADADGPVRFAFRQPGVHDGCELWVQDINEGRFGIRVNGDGSTPTIDGSEFDGLIWGNVGELEPHLGPTNNDEQWWDWSIGTGMVLKMPG